MSELIWIEILPFSVARSWLGLLGKLTSGWPIPALASSISCRARSFNRLCLSSVSYHNCTKGFNFAWGLNLAELFQLVNVSILCFLSLFNLYLFNILCSVYQNTLLQIMFIIRNGQCWFILSNEFLVRSQMNGFKKNQTAVCLKYMYFIFLKNEYLSSPSTCIHVWCNYL